MFTSFHIERFRGIPSLHIDGVKPATLLVGKNNTGKTSVLEAIFLLCGATNPYIPTVIGQLRGQRITTAGDADSVWRSLFHEMGSAPIEIEGWWDGEGQRRLDLKPLENIIYADDSMSPFTGVVKAGGRPRIHSLLLTYTSPTVEARVPDGQILSKASFDRQAQQVSITAISREPSVENYSARSTLLSSRSFFNLARDTEQHSILVRTRQDEVVVNALRLIDPRVRRLAVISEPSGATVYADLGGDSLIPLAVCGEGVLRLFSIILAVIGSRDGVLLVDEIDNGLHHSVMAELWPAIRHLAAQHNVQLIATTHNEEMLKYAIGAYRDDLTQLGLIRLDRLPGGLRAVSYNAEALEGVAETGWEVRG